MPHIGEKAERQTTLPGLAESVDVGASPFTYTAARQGMLLMSGGTVSLIQYGRGGTMFSLGVLAGPVGVMSGDQVRITYALAPTLTFLPNT
jgi:hypothetical protein